MLMKKTVITIALLQFQDHDGSRAQYHLSSLVRITIVPFSVIFLFRLLFQPKFSVRFTFCFQKNVREERKKEQIEVINEECGRYA